MTVYAACCARCGQWTVTAVTVTDAVGIHPYCRRCADAMGYGKGR